MSSLYFPSKTNIFFKVLKPALTLSLELNISLQKENTNSGILNQFQEEVMQEYIFYEKFSCFINLLNRKKEKSRKTTRSKMSVKNLYLFLTNLNGSISIWVRLKTSKK